MGVLADARTILGLDQAELPEWDARHQARASFETEGPGGMPTQVALGMFPANPDVAGSVVRLRDRDRPPSSKATDDGKGRLTWDTPFQMMGSGTYVVLPPDSALESWRTFDLDASTIRNLSATRLLRILADASPDVSRALWDFLRMCNPGWEIKAYKPGKSHVAHNGAQNLVDDFVDRMTDKYGTLDVIVSKMYFSAFLFGSMCVEMVLDLDGRTAIDLATPDVGSLRFMLTVDPVLGAQWIMGQFQGGRSFVPLQRETIRYIPIDPAPGQPPYGRAPAGPALFSTLFLLGLLQDLRRVVAQQGYPRYDISVSLQRLQDSMPATLQLADPNAWKQWVTATLN